MYHNDSDMDLFWRPNIQCKVLVQTESLYIIQIVRINTNVNRLRGLHRWTAFKRSQLFRTKLLLLLNLKIILNQNLQTSVWLWIQGPIWNFFPREVLNRIKQLLCKYFTARLMTIWLYKLVVKAKPLSLDSSNKYVYECFEDKKKTTKVQWLL